MAIPDTLFEQLRRSYESESDLKKTLEDKAKNTITVSGFIITLLFGFNSFLISGIADPTIKTCIYFIVLASIVSASFAVIYALLALRLQSYMYVLSQDAKNPSAFDTALEEYQKLDEKELKNRLIAEYSFSIKINSSVNETKTHHVLKSQTCTVIALLIIPIVISIMIYSLIAQPTELYTNNILLNPSIT